MTKQETIDLLGKQLPGFYSVEQVIKMITDIEEPEISEFHSDSIRELCDNIAESLSSEGTDLIDDYDLSISGREVELDSVDLDENRIARVVKDIVEDFFEKYKQIDA